MSTTVQMHDHQQQHQQHQQQHQQEQQQEKGVAESFELISKKNARQHEQYAPSLLVSRDQHHDNRSCCTKALEHLRHPESLLVILIMVGAVIGIVIGCVVDKQSTTAILLIKFPGDIFMRMLKMMIVPIIVTSIITGLASIEIRNLKRIGLHALCYYMTTTLIAVVLGILLVLTIQPGRPTTEMIISRETQMEVSTLDTFMDLIRNLFPDNIFSATFSGSQTRVETIELMTDQNETITKLRREQIKTASPNTLGLIVFSLFFGGVISFLGVEAVIVKDFFEALNKIFMKIIMMFLWVSPIGICSLIAGNLLSNISLSGMMSTLGLYMLTTILGLTIHSCIILPLIYFVITRKNPFKLFKATFKAILIAFGTASSAGTLPVSMKCLENFGVHKQIINLVLPLGATMNMDGTALLEGVASITIAQMYATNLSLAQIIIVSLTATFASIGAAAIPSAGLVTLLMVLTSIGVPTEAVGILWTIDWILDRIRTSVNVFGDCVGSSIVHHLNADQLSNCKSAKSESVTENSS